MAKKTEEIPKKVKTPAVAGAGRKPKKGAKITINVEIFLGEKGLEKEAVVAYEAIKARNKTYKEGILEAMVLFNEIIETSKKQGVPQNFDTLMYWLKTNIGGSGAKKQDFVQEEVETARTDISVRAVSTIKEEPAPKNSTPPDLFAGM
jgi:hypothetical protein